MIEIQESLKKKYNIHPLLFQRCIEKARTDGELFDLLETMPKSFPIIWDDEKRLWIETDLLQKPK